MALLLEMTPPHRYLYASGLQEPETDNMQSVRRVCVYVVANEHSLEHPGISRANKNKTNAKEGGETMRGLIHMK